MMPYYSDEQHVYLIDGVPVLLTEEQAERYQAGNQDVEVIAGRSTDIESLEEDELVVYWVDGQPALMTEEEFADLQYALPDAKITEQFDDETDDDEDTIDCTCEGTNDLCSACEEFWRNYNDDN
jgi:hypothetical protein